jgi:glutathionyl-hydroquinone reductase
MMSKKSGLIAPTTPASSQLIQPVIKLYTTVPQFDLSYLRMFSFETTIYDLANLWIVVVIS